MDIGLCRRTERTHSAARRRPPGSGKSLLLKRLQNQVVTKITVPIETVGTNLVTVFNTSSEEERNSKNSRKRDNGLEIREVGGTMAPLWSSYYGPSIKSILFVIDTNNLFQVSISTVLLMEILTHAKLAQARLLVVLTKVDITTRKRVNYLKFMMRLQNIIQESGGRVSTEEVSALTNEGVENVRSWLFKKNSKVATTSRH